MQIWTPCYALVAWNLRQRLNAMNNSSVMIARETKYMNKVKHIKKTKGNSVTKHKSGPTSSAARTKLNRYYTKIEKEFVRVIELHLQGNLCNSVTIKKLLYIFEGLYILEELHILEASYPFNYDIIKKSYHLREKITQAIIEVNKKNYY
jgi:hypothetical protein